MAKDKYAQIQKNLEEAVDKLDMDGVVYRLISVAVAYRDAAAKGTNRAEERFWQNAIEVLLQAQQDLEEVS